MKIDGKQIASNILEELKPKVEELKNKSIIPTLAIILIGDDEASKSYIKQKQLKAEEIGAEIRLFHYDTTSEGDLINLIQKLNEDNSIHGIIVQRPLPHYFDRSKISELINPDKDVDGFNSNSKFNAPVAEAIIEIFKSINLELDSKKIVLIGKGETAGGPIYKLLSEKGFNIEVITHETKNPDEIIKNADIIISAVGKENIINPDILNSKQILIGVGLFIKDGKLKGDYNEAEVENKVKYFTPVIGGVGPINVACLMRNLILKLT